MRVLILAFVFFISVSNAWAEGMAFTCKANSSITASVAVQLIQKTQTAYNSLKTLKARFSQDAYLSAMDISEISTGNVWFVKPGRMKWHYLDPEEQIFVVRDDTVWLYQLADKQVVVDRFQDILISDLPVAFLMGIGNLANDFTLIKACENADDGSYLFELAPKSESLKKDQQLKGFSLLVDRVKFLPKGARVQDIASNINSIIFAEIQENPTVPEDTFDTNFPAGTDINDRRVMREEN